MIYFGDTARLPYGNKSGTTVKRLSLEALRFLEHFGIKALVVACNSASALALDALESEAAVPVLGVVDAGARRAVEATGSGRIGVIGTRGTIDSQCYNRALEEQRPGLEVFSAACPLFVPLVEEGWTDHSTTRRIAAEYLASLIESRVDTLILGCTHYPLLKPMIAEVMGEDVKLIDSGEAMAVDVRRKLDELGLASGAGKADHRFFVSDQPDRFHAEGQRFLGEEVLGSVEAVDQSDIPWYDRSSIVGGLGGTRKDS
jgi:glutamate racemase